MSYGHGSGGFGWALMAMALRHSFTRSMRKRHTRKQQRKRQVRAFFGLFAPKKAARPTQQPRHDGPATTARDRHKANEILAAQRRQQREIERLNRQIERLQGGAASAPRRRRAPETPSAVQEIYREDPAPAGSPVVPDAATPHTGARPAPAASIPDWQRLAQADPAYRAQLRDLADVLCEMRVARGDNKLLQRKHALALIAQTPPPKGEDITTSIKHIRAHMA